MIATVALPSISGYDMSKNKACIMPSNVVDQHQFIFSYQCGLILFEYKYAQSFKPSKTPLVEIGIAVNAPSSEAHLMVSIRTDLEGPDITSIVVPSSEITQDYISWNEFDIPDIDVTPESTYYIVLEHMGGESGFILGLSDPSDGTDPYDRGSGWHWSTDTGWEIMGYPPRFNTDLAFKTYTYGQNQPPDTPSIDGPTSGKPNTIYEYEFKTYDPDGDDVFYDVYWGDGGQTYTYGPYPSDEATLIGFQWNTKGTKTIAVMARDVNSAESEWATLEVSIPKYKPTNTPFLQFLENHPHLFPLLRQLLEL